MELTQGDRATDGHALGINIRVSGYAGVDSATAAAVGHVVGQSAASFQAPIAALPVSRSGADADLTVISQMLSHGDHPADVTMRDLSAPRDLATETANCRAIVTGSYHAAVFGLGQGVPTVCVTKSSYYDGKFNGLRALFPESCFVISLTSPGFSDRLRAAIDQAWHLPASSRAQASEAAARQREAAAPHTPSSGCWLRKRLLSFMPLKDDPGTASAAVSGQAEMGFLQSAVSLTGYPLHPNLYRVVRT